MKKRLPAKVRQMVDLLKRHGVHPLEVSQRPADSAWDIELFDGYKVSVFGLDYSVSCIVYDDEGGCQAQLSRLMRKHADVIEKLRAYGYGKLEALG